MTFSACAQSVQRNGALAISSAGTSPDSDGIDGAEMSSAPDLTCWIRSPSLPSCSAGNTGS